MTIRAAILGGTGYGGMELFRYLLAHPEIEVVALTSRSQDGPVSDAHPHLRGVSELCFTKEAPDTISGLASDVDVLFSARPHGVAAHELPPLLEAHASLRVVDLSGDFRLKDPSLYPRWYGWEHPHPSWLSQAAYGLSEVVDPARIEAARLVANPGCHATGALLALAPLAATGSVVGRPRVVSVTGSTGSGAKPKAGTHHPERFGNFKAYRPLQHQHVPEIEQALLGRAKSTSCPVPAPLPEASM